jgi:hypothetical protein
MVIGLDAAFPARDDQILLVVKLYEECGNGRRLERGGSVFRWGKGGISGGSAVFFSKKRRLNGDGGGEIALWFKVLFLVGEAARAAFF